VTRRATAAGIALVLLLAGCGRVGPPVRSQAVPVAPAAAGAEAEAGEDRESEKEKP